MGPGRSESVPYWGVGIRAVVLSLLSLRCSHCSLISLFVLPSLVASFVVIGAGVIVAILFFVFCGYCVVVSLYSCLFVISLFLLFIFNVFSSSAS